MKRREFIKAAAICSAASAAPGALAREPVTLKENGSMTQIPLISSAGTRRGDMRYRTLGRTGERSLRLEWVASISLEMGLPTSRA